MRANIEQSASKSKSQSGEGDARKRNMIVLASVMGVAAVGVLVYNLRPEPLGVVVAPVTTDAAPAVTATPDEAAQQKRMQLSERKLNADGVKEVRGVGAKYITDKDGNIPKDPDAP